MFGLTTPRQTPPRPAQPAPHGAAGGPHYHLIRAIVGF